MGSLGGHSHFEGSKWQKYYGLEERDVDMVRQRRFIVWQSEAWVQRGKTDNRNSQYLWTSHIPYQKKIASLITTLLRAQIIILLQ